MKKIAILGSTGSIGCQTLSVIDSNSDKLKVHSLVAFSNERLISEQGRKYGVQGHLISIEGNQCLIDAVVGCDIAVIATLGITALDAVMYCLDNHIDVAIANKEVLVTAGALIRDKLSTSKSRLLPVDSEHSAIWQCLCGNCSKIDKLYLTASGGALFDWNNEKLQKAKASDALQHPNWEMGKKITIDSATMMNKALEVVEAHWLFDVDVNDIEIVVHRQSIVHSMVKFTDNSIIAQMSQPDMALPIQYALLYPYRGEGCPKQLDLFSMPPLTFVECDYEKFPCAKLGSFMLSEHLLIATVVNACNDICVENYLADRLFFNEIYDTIMCVAEQYRKIVEKLELTVQNIKKIDSDVRDFAAKFIMERK